MKNNKLIHLFFFLKGTPRSVCGNSPNTFYSNWRIFASHCHIQRRPRKREFCLCIRC